MGKISRIIDRLSEKNQFSTYLAIFRVFVGFHLIKKIYLGWGSISLIYGDLIDTQSATMESIPFLSYSMGEIPLIVLLMLILSFLFIFGIGKMFTAALLWLCLYVNGQLTYLYNNGGDNLLIYLSLYLIFANSYEYLSFSKLTIRKESIRKLFNLTSNLAVYSMMIHLCLVYFVSFSHKVHADVWFNGVATYYILNLEQFSSPLNDLFSRNAFVVAFSTYFTLAFELLFPLFVWDKRFRNILLISGIGLHAGIYFFMMIYDFEILFVMIYGFFLTNEEWTHILKKVRSRFERLQRLPVVQWALTGMNRLNPSRRNSI